MRKIFILLALSLFFAPMVLNASTVNVLINENPVDFEGQPPIILEGRTIIPIRGVFEALNFDVQWDGDTQRVTLTRDDYIIAITVGQPAFMVNGASYPLDVPAIIIEGRTMLPLRAILERAGYFVDWDGGSATVFITNSQREPIALNWLVAPNLPHTSIRLCNCGFFFDIGGTGTGDEAPPIYMWRAIDPVTGQLTGDYHNGHGGPPPGFVYDRERGLFGHPGYDFGYHDFIGMHPLNAFEEAAGDKWWILESSAQLIAVQSVDSSMRRINPDYWNNPDGWHLSAEAYSGRFALMYNREFITDFRFDAVNPHQFGLNLISVRQGGKWGVIGTEGSTVLPFVFDNLILIDENSAFAKYNGSYGIIGIGN